ncbi:MAG TPA: S8 family peptidase [Bryobacteraceae bacterium]|nr:S8 family peptidase [Bryobacteraceae bacterium]
MAKKKSSRTDNSGGSRPGDPAQDEATPAKSAQERAEEQLKRHDQMLLNMMRSIVTEPLLGNVRDALENNQPDSRFDIIISLNEFYKDGIPAALEEVKKRAAQWGVKSAASSHYVFACLTAKQIMNLAEEARTLIREQGQRATVVYRIWEDNDVSVSLTRSLSTVKVDAAQRSFQARGEGIVWAVLDSGIQGDHPHFKYADSTFGPINALSIESPVSHLDYTPLNNGPLKDEFGHGTHVAGIIAGFWKSADPKGQRVVGVETRDESNNEAIPQRESLTTICGVAPACRLVSMKVIADTTDSTAKQTAGQGKVSWVLLAIDQIQQWNQYGKRLLVHGVNMSLGYDFDPRWFACGQSPLCVEVNRLVKSGVSVVVSAGNAGYSAMLTSAQKAVARYSDISITDPGNAALAITVGSTHREMPHTYGVSYFSSRGPTGDGRMKPDLVAPGERIISCAAGLEQKKYPPGKDGDGADLPVLYCEQTGTSMAAPHVSGAIAAFLSVRREFIGQPEQVKQLFLDNAIDLGREPKFQGAGLLDLMKVLQAV